VPEQSNAQIKKTDFLPTAPTPIKQTEGY